MSWKRPTPKLAYTVRPRGGGERVKVYTAGPGRHDIEASNVVMRNYPGTGAKAFDMACRLVLPARRVIGTL